MDAEYPELGVTVKVVVAPWPPKAEVGLMVPPVPVVVETRYWFSVKLAFTVQAPVIGPVV